MQPKKAVNWFALASGALMLIVVALSIFTPWWKLQIGNGSGLVTINANPFYTNFNVLRLNFVVPVLFALNIGTMVLFAVSGVVFIIYAVMPAKRYSKHLLSYGWKRPLYTLIVFMAVLMLILYVAPHVINAMSHTSVIPVPLVPIIGSSKIQIPSNIFGGGSNSVQIGVTMNSTFEYTFYLAVVAAALGIVARIYHRRIVSNVIIPAPAAVTTSAPVSTPSPQPLQ